MTMPWTLMYHSVAAERPDPLHITVSPDRFDRQMRWLRDHHLRGVSMADLLTSPAPDKVGLTFDDGYQDFHDQVTPILLRFGFTATVFVVTDLVGGHNQWDPAGVRKSLMNAAQIRAVAAAGMEIGSHGLAHRSLPACDRGLLWSELADSRGALAELTGRQIAGFCYPYGDLCDDALTAAMAAGYTYACATWQTGDRNRFALPRTYMGERDSGARLAAKRLRHRLTWGWKR